MQETLKAIHQGTGTKAEYARQVYNKNKIKIGDRK